MSVVVAERRTDDGVELRIDGDLDMASAPTVRARALQSLASSPMVLRLKIDEIGLIDDVGVGVLLGVRRRALERGVSFECVCSESQAAQLMAFGVSDLFC